MFEMISMTNTRTTPQFRVSVLYAVAISGSQHINGTAWASLMHVMGSMT